MNKKEAAEISKGFDTHSDLLGESYLLNRNLLHKKDALIEVQRKFIDKCEELAVKKIILGDLEQRLTGLQEKCFMETDFINLTEGDSPLNVSDEICEELDSGNLTANESKLIDSVEGLNNFLTYVFK